MMRCSDQDHELDEGFVHRIDLFMDDEPWPVYCFSGKSR